MNIFKNHSNKQKQYPKLEKNIDTLNNTTGHIKTGLSLKSFFYVDQESFKSREVHYILSEKYSTAL